MIGIETCSAAAIAVIAVTEAHMKPAPQLIGALTPHRHDFAFHHECRGLRYYLCRVCGKVYSVRSER